MKSVRILLMLACASALLSGDTRADTGCCEHCGCRHKVKKVCRLVCETKKEKKAEYCCETEDFCVPGRSQRCGTTCDCDGHRKPVWKPTCARVRTKTKLVKKEVTKEVPTWKWVVEEICCDCQANLEHETAREVAENPAESAGGEVLAASVEEEIRDEARPESVNPRGKSTRRPRKNFLSVIFPQ